MQAAKVNAKAKLAGAYLFSPTQDKIELIKISTSSENKKYPAAQPVATQSITMKVSKDNPLPGRTDRTAADKSGLQKWWWGALYDSEVHYQNLVLRLKFCGENRHLPKAAIR